MHASTGVISAHGTSRRLDSGEYLRSGRVLHSPRKHLKTGNEFYCQDLLCWRTQARYAVV